MAGRAGAPLLRNGGMKMMEVLRAIAEGGRVARSLSGQEFLIVAGKTKIVNFRGIWGINRFRVGPGQQF